jgi:hypothetical protein
MSMACEKTKTWVKISGPSPSISLMVCGRQNLSCLTACLGQSAKMCWTLSCTLQGARMAGDFLDRRWMSVRWVWPTHQFPWTHNGRQIGKKTSTGVPMISLLTACCPRYSPRPFVSQSRLMEGGPKIQTVNTRYKDALDSSVPGHGKCCLTATDTDKMCKLCWELPS